MSERSSFDRLRMRSVLLIHNVVLMLSLSKHEDGSVS
jgi:hypothetical protein